MVLEKCEFVLPRGAMVRFFDESGENEISKGIFIGPEDNSEFIAVPLADRKNLTIKVGDRVLVRYGYHGTMAEFCSEFTEILERPVLLWRIRIPGEVNRFELRDHKRINCVVAATVEMTEKGLFGGAIIRDISKSGARCVLQASPEMNGQLSIGDDILMNCTFPGVSGGKTTPGKIAEVSESSDELTIGIQFDEAQEWVPPYH